MSKHSKSRSEEHKQKIRTSNLGKKKKTSVIVCNHCGKQSTGIKSKKFCSRFCRKGYNGITKIHMVDFAIFEKVCAICGKTSQLVGDHCHKSGKPRGILCRNCNLAIGNFFDSVTYLKKAIKYLENE